MSLSNLAALSSLKGFAGTLTGASTLALSLFFTSAEVDSSGGVTDVDGTGDSLTYSSASDSTGLRRQWNADGVLEYAPHNLVRAPSNNLNDADWGVNNCVLTQGDPDPNGGTTAYSLVADSGSVSVDISESGNGIRNGIRQSWSFHAKYETIRWIELTTVDGSVLRSFFDIQNGVVGTIGHTSSTIEDAGNGWYRCTVYWTGGASNLQVYLSPRPADASASPITGDGVTVQCYIWGPQLRLEPSDPAFIHTTAANTPVYGPRVGTRNRKPVTNLLSYPEQFDNAVWTKTRSSVSSGQADPFGGSNAFKLVEASGSPTLDKRLDVTHPSTGGKTHTLSVYAKAGERSWLYIQFGTSSGNRVNFNLSTGVVGTTSGLTGYGIAPVEGASGWYHCWATDDGTHTTSYFKIATADETFNYDGDGTSGLYIFGAQLNEGGIEDYVGAYTHVQQTAGFDKNFAAGWFTTGGAGVVTADTTVAPDGTTTADTLGDNSSGVTGLVLLRGATGGSGLSALTETGIYNFSLFVKQKQLSWVHVFTSGWLVGASAYFDVGAGAVGTTSNTNANIEYYGNGWYRCSLTIDVSDLVGEVRIAIADADNDTTVDLDGTSDIYIWGAQLTKGSTLYPYVGMPQTGFTKQGYLAEAAATNLNTKSEEFTDATVWNISNTDSLTLTAASALGPDGLASLTKFAVTDTTSEVHRMSDVIAGTTTNADYCFSLFARAEDQRYIWLRWYGSTENFISAVYDLYTGTVTATDVGTTSGTITGSGVIDCGNGLYRLWLAGRVNVANMYSDFGTSNSATPTFTSEGAVSYAGAGGEAFYAGCTQCETGTYPSSYIRTSGSTELRAADTLRIADITGFYDELKGTLVSDVTNISDGDSAGVGLLDTSNPFNYHILPQSAGSTSMRLSVRDGGTPDFVTLTSSTVRARQVRNKYAVAYSETDQAFATHVKGTASSAAFVNVTMPVAGIDELAIYKGQTGAAEAGYIKSLQYYSERKSDADLATLSTITDDGTSWRDELNA